MFDSVSSRSSSVRGLHPGSTAPTLSISSPDAVGRFLTLDSTRAYSKIKLKLLGYSSCHQCRPKCDLIGTHHTITRRTEYLARHHAVLDGDWTGRKLLTIKSRVALAKADRKLGTINKRLLQLYRDSSGHYDWKYWGDTILQDHTRLCEYRDALEEVLNSAPEADSTEDIECALRGKGARETLQFSDNPVDISERLGLETCGLEFAGMFL